MKNLFLLLIIFFSFKAVAQEKKYLNNQSFTYQELIAAYEQIAAQSPYAKLVELGKTDLGKPLHLFIIDKDKTFATVDLAQRKKSVIFINNGIHPGEACGIDASVELAKKLTNPKHKMFGALDSVIVILTPIYNVGGMLNRGSFSRANQNGPEEHGFRGNAKNLDLNRDFIKCDSKNAMLLNQLFTKWNPDVFVETHTTNGSDHTYTLTLISSQKSKLHPEIVKVQHNHLDSALYQAMEEKGMAIIPYVYSLKGDPKKGIMAFLETPRYSSGYAALKHSIAYITEAHVFKTFKQRVTHTLSFLETLTEKTALNNQKILAARRAAYAQDLTQKTQAIQWKLDTSSYTEIGFKGYEKVSRESEVTKLNLSFYDAENEYHKKIKFYDTYQAKTTIRRPNYYLIPQAYDEVIERLRWNGIDMKQLTADTAIAVEFYRILNSKTPKRPYEGHFLHSAVEVAIEVDTIQFYQGDYLISTQQEGVNYLSHVLEPQAVDGFFTWNFFDGILQQKEWFSDYAFEPIAKELLASNPELKKEFEAKRASDKDFAESNFSQLYFIYKRSPYYEKTVNRFPVYRIQLNHD